MSAFFKQRIVRGAHARISAQEQRTSSRTGLLVLVVIFIALVAILLRLAEFAGRQIPSTRTPRAPAMVLFYPQ